MNTTEGEEMTKEELMPFCDEEIPNFKEPWTKGNWTYATNGKICIRVPAVDGVEENAFTPQADRLFDTAFAPKQWSPVPKVEKPEQPKEIECDECEGSGKSDENQCEFCGKYPECEECGGSGKIMKPPLVKKKEIDGVIFDEKYLYLIQKLPGIEIGVNSLPDASRFRFDGGEGLLMPMRR